MFSYLFYSIIFVLITRGHVAGVRGGSKEGAIWAIAPLKPTKITSFTILFYNSENSICDIRPFCRPLFCHSSVVKYTSSLLQ